MIYVAEAGAAEVFNALPALMQLPAPVRYRRLVELFENALAVAAEVRKQQLEPSVN